MGLSKHIIEHEKLGFAGSSSSASPELLFGQVLVGSSNGNRIFAFLADGSDEIATFTLLWDYVKAELVAGRDAVVKFGIGKFGMDGNGFNLTFERGSTVTILGSGKPTEIGFVGNTPLGGNKALFDIKTNFNDTNIVTGTVGAHNATVGSRIRAYQIGNAASGDVPKNGITPIDGEHLVTAITATTVTYVAKVPVTVALGVAPQISIFNNYLKGLEIGNFMLFDDNPAAHVNGGEESHGMFITSVINPHVHDIWSRGIGDEAVELIRCEGYNVKNIIGVNSPSVQTGGGGLCSIKNGCWNGVVDTVMSREPFSELETTLTSCLSLKTAGNALDMGGMVARNIIGNYPENSTINFGTAGARITNISIHGVIATGGEIGVSASGSFLLSEVDIYDLKANQQTERPVQFAAGAAAYKGIRLHNPQLDGSHLASTDKELIRMNGNDNRLFNPTLSNALSAFFKNGGTGMRIIGGTVDNCGGSGNGGIIMRDTGSQDTVVDGTIFTNIKSTTAGFNGIEKIINCPEINFTSIPFADTALNIVNFSGNSKVNMPIKMDKPNGRAENNEFTRTTTEGLAGMILLSASNILCTGNTAPNLVTGGGIAEAVGVDRNIIKNNNMNSAGVTTVGASTIAADNL